MNQATRLFAAAVAAVCVCHLDAEVHTASTAEELTAAISAAASGDEIRLAAGTWTIAAQITASKALTLSGGWDADFETRADDAVTTLDGADASNLLSLSPGSGECIVERISFTRSLSSALVKSGAGTLLVEDCSFLANAAAATAQGRALNLSGTGAVTIRNCRFEGNVATLDNMNERQGGAVFANGVGHLTVEDSDFIANGLSMSVITNNGPANQGLGGAALCIHGTPCEIRRCEFRGNASRGHDRDECGGTVLLYGNCDGSVIEDCLFAGNQCLRSPWGQMTSGAVYVCLANTERSVTIRGCTFAYNLGIPASVPSGLYVYSGNARVVDSVFYGNIVQNANVVAKDLAAGGNGTIEISHSMLTVNGPASFSGTVLRGEGMLYGDPLFATDAATAESYVSSSSKTFDAARLADICAMDLHMKSASGRWTSSGWVEDEANSPTLDWGTDEAAWENEPAPNGNRRNIGYYGNTSEASKSEPAAPRLADVTISYPTPYTKPTVTVTAGATGGTYYNATLTVVYDTGSAQYTSVSCLVGIGDVKTVVTPEYFDPGQVITIRVELAVRGQESAVYETEHTVDPTKVRPPWIGHGGDPEKIIHVRGGADSAQDGTSWTDAFGDIASALAAVTAAKNEIWICGTVECLDTLMPLTPPADVVIRGGFTAEEDELEDRDPDVSKRATIDFKDQGGPLKLAIPSGRKVSIERLDIVHGAENGIYKTDAGELYVANSTIECNGLYAPYAQGRGVNLAGNGSTATFTNCLFAGNAVCQPIGHNGTLNGGAIYASGLGCLRLIDSQFLTNGVAVTSKQAGPAPFGYGGAAVYATGTKVVASGCEFRGNVATAHNSGTTGAVRLYGSGCAGSSFTNCVFVGNSNLIGNYYTASSGALNVSLGGADNGVDVVNCTIAYNLDGVPAGAAGLYVDNATVNLISSIVYGNRPRNNTTGASDLLTSGTGNIRSSYSLITADTLAVHRGNFTDVIGTFFGDPLFVTSADDFNACVLAEGDHVRFVTSTPEAVAAVCDFDVHLKAKLGYWLNDGTYVTSGDVNSPALDKGDPTADYSREEEPNGGRVNAGCYGNTPEASHSRVDKPEIASVEITYPDGYPQPNVAVTMGGAAGSEYSETVYIMYGTGDVAQCGYAFTNVFSNVKYGEVVRGVAPHYFAPGEEIAISVVVSPLSLEPIVRGIPESVPSDLVYPAWYGKGGGDNVVHVRAGANCMKTGADWTDAFPDFTSAIAALKGGKTEIWVAGHVFASGVPQTLSPGGPVAIRGGFAGFEESASEREEGLRSTVDGNATYDFLVINNAAERPVRLERLVLTRAEARGLTKSGAGELVMDDCVIQANGRNYMSGGGRGVSLTGGQQVTITNCVFVGNVADTGSAVGMFGGAVYASGLGRLTVVDTQFVTNGIEFARFTQAQPWNFLTGTAIYANNTPVTLSGCAFRANGGCPHDNEGRGGTVLLTGNSGGSVISNCLFVGNMDAKPRWGSSAGGTVHIALNTADAAVDMVNCTLAFNVTDGGGAGGICVQKGCLNLVNSIVYGNRQFSATNGPRDLDIRADGTVNASYCLFTGDAEPYIRCTGTTNFTNVIYADPKFVTTDAEVQAQREVGTQRYRLDNECAAAVCGFNVHVRGTSGYIDELTGELVPAYPKDECSPAIDAGDPASTAWVRERSPRGHRTNLGAYGGTPYSSGIATGFMIIVR